MFSDSTSSEFFMFVNKVINITQMIGSRYVMYGIGPGRTQS